MFAHLTRYDLQSDAELSETVKYGMPCFCLAQRAVCYLWTDEQSGYPYILFVDGNKLEHPSLLAGSRKRMKVLKVNPHEDIPVKLITDVLNSMLSVYRS